MSDNRDIVNRLEDTLSDEGTDWLQVEAANEIRELRTEIERLRKRAGRCSGSRDQKAGQ